MMMTLGESSDSVNMMPKCITLHQIEYRILKMSRGDTPNPRLGGDRIDLGGGGPDQVSRQIDALIMMYVICHYH